MTTTGLVSTPLLQLALESKSCCWAWWCVAVFLVVGEAETGLLLQDSSTLANSRPDRATEGDLVCILTDPATQKGDVRICSRPEAGGTLSVESHPLQVWDPSNLIPADGKWLT